MIEITNINKTYKMASHKVVALDNVTLRIEQGDFLALKGPSGSGKTTMLNIFGLIDVPTQGSYRLDEVLMDGLNAKQRSNYRRKYLGFIFQNYNLIPELNIYENVEIPLLISGVKKSIRKEMVENTVEELGLKDHIKHKPGELSGGQQQRVAIARALVKKPPVIIADEPTANLDTKTGQEIIKLMKDLNERHCITFIFATHDELILDLMKTVVYLQDGRVLKVEKGGGTTA